METIKTKPFISLILSATLSFIIVHNIPNFLIAITIVKGSIFFGNYSTDKKVEWLYYILL